MAPGQAVKIQVVNRIVDTMRISKAEKVKKARQISVVCGVSSDITKSYMESWHVEYFPACLCNSCGHFYHQSELVWDAGSVESVCPTPFCGSVIARRESASAESKPLFPFCCVSMRQYLELLLLSDEFVRLVQVRPTATVAGDISDVHHSGRWKEFEQEGFGTIDRPMDLCLQVRGCGCFVALTVLVCLSILTRA
jgi:hypothetical protein